MLRRLPNFSGARPTPRLATTSAAFSLRRSSGGRGRKHPQQEFLQVDTTNILFVCGGAFGGLEKIISARGRGFARHGREEGAKIASACRRARGGSEKECAKQDRSPPQCVHLLDVPRQRASSHGKRENGSHFFEEVDIDPLDQIETAMLAYGDRQTGADGAWC
jgi:hypothetical protein